MFNTVLNVLIFPLQSWGGVLSSWMGIRNQSTESIDIQTTENEVEKKRKRTCDFVDQPRPRFYGFQGWRMYKDYNKRMCVKEHFATRMRLNAVRKNAILPQALRVSIWDFLVFIKSPSQ